MTEKFDVVIVGAGPAGISAAITTARAKIKYISNRKREHTRREKIFYGGINF